MLLLIAGITVLNLVYTLLGISLTVRFKKLTDFLIPVIVLMIFLEIPILYFAGLVPHPILLVFPSSPPVMLIQSAFIEIEPWKWIYTLG